MDDSAPPDAPRPAAPEAPCPCGFGPAYAQCCGRFHRGDAQAPTAAALMRSRYAAFAVGDAGYLLRTWDRRTRPRRLVLDDDVRWTRLVIVDTAGGGLLDTEGVVEFVAQYEATGADGGRARGRQHERSRFARDGSGAWMYVDGQA